MGRIMSNYLSVFSIEFFFIVRGSQVFFLFDFLIAYISLTCKIINRMARLKGVLLVNRYSIGIASENSQTVPVERNSGCQRVPVMRVVELWTC